MALALFRSNRTCGLLVFLAMLVVGSPRARRGGDVVSRPGPQNCAIARRRGIAAEAAADALYAGEPIERSPRPGWARSKRPAGRKPKRSAFGCSSASGRRPPPLRPLRRRPSTWSSAARDGERSASKTYAGLAPTEMLTAATCRTLADDPREPDASELRERARSRESGDGRGGHHQFEGRERFGDDNGARDLGRILGAYQVTGHGCSAWSSPARARLMWSDHAWHSSRHLSDLEPAAEIGRRAGDGRFRGSIRRARNLANIRCCSAVSSTLLGHLAGAISGSSIARRTSFLKLGTRCSPRASRSSTIRSARAGSAHGRSTPRACACRGRSRFPTEFSTAGWRRARRPGSWASRRRARGAGSAAPERRAEQLLHGARGNEAAKSCSPHSPKRFSSSS